MIGAAPVALTLVGCNRRDDSSTTGQKVDSAMAKVDAKADAAKAVGSSGRASAGREVELTQPAAAVGAGNGLRSVRHRTVFEGAQTSVDREPNLPSMKRVQPTFGHLVADSVSVTLLADRPIKRWDAVVKAGVDLLIGGLITVLLLPLLAIIALAIRIDSPGPVIFKQRRHAQNNREFEIYKFRTMRWKVSAAAEDLRQTSRRDERITSLGRFLRASSLDELPQLFNVLKGDMSLVGPRPHAVDMRTEGRLGHEITDLYPQRHRVKPGITGWSQVNGARGATDTVEQLRRRVTLDLHYIENWSLLLDLKILALTSREVIKGNNAY